MKMVATIFLLFYSTNLLAQEYPRKNIDVQKLTDELLAQDLDMNYEELYENLLQILSNPLSINIATEEDFRFLNILTETQLQNLLSYRKEQGGFTSIYELQSIDDFDVQTIQRFAPFVVVKTNQLKTSFLKSIASRQNTYLILRYDYTLQEKKGFTTEVDPASKFLGSQPRIYTRFRSSKPGDYSIGFTLEKDAGEAMLWRPKNQYYGFDYSSFHLQVQNKGRIKNLIVGDFQGQFGQGLLLGGFFGFGKGAETITTTRRSSIGFIPYTSVHESGMLRGAAVTLQANKHIDLSVYYSQKRKDARLNQDDGDGHITSFQTTGLHRNEKELATRNKILESNYGIVANFQYKKLNGGIIMNGTSFENRVQKSKSVYNQFTFEGMQNNNVGGFATYSFNNFNFFGEVAKSLNGGWGGVAGVLGSLTDKIDISLLFRKYDPDFYSFYSNAFGESGLPQNEAGVYWGWKYTANRKLSIAGYLDLFSFKWLRYRSYAPSVGHEWLLRLNYSLNKKSLFYFQYKEEQKVMNSPGDTNLYYTTAGIKRSALINLSYSLADNLQMKTRAQASTYRFNKNPSQGIAIMQDVDWKLNKFGITGRYALFQTDDYDNRQYTYERDAYLAYSFPAYYGKGVRTYLMLEYTLNKYVSFWLRFSQTRYLNQETIGSGVDTIEGNQRNDIRIQLVLRP